MRTKIFILSVLLLAALPLQAQAQTHPQRRQTLRTLQTNDRQKVENSRKRRDSVRDTQTQRRNDLQNMRNKKRAAERLLADPPERHLNE